MNVNFEHVQVFENKGGGSKLLDKYERILTEFHSFVSNCLAQEPENVELISLWENVDKLRMRFGLPYIFPGGLGKAQTIDGVSGLLSLGDLEALNFCSKQVKNNCVNIGVFEGLSAYFIARSNREIKVYGIDAYLGMNGKGKEFNHERYDKANKNLKFLNNAQLIVGLSADVAKEWTADIEFLFIDGDHSVEGAISDFRTWSPFLTNNGFIAVHDAYIKVNKGFFKWREKNNIHGPDCICKIMDEDPTYEFVMVKGCTEIWKKKS